MKTKFEQQLKDKLISVENNLDADTVTQLDDVRKRAFEGYRKPWALYLQQSLWPAGAMVTASLLMFMLLFGPMSPLPSHDKLAIEGQKIENLELLEDLEFYYWLSENQEKLKG